MKLLFVLFLISSFAAAAQTTSATQFIVVAHRGDHSNAPENTMKAYEDAVAAGVDLVEIDLRSTKDNQLVIMHDETVDRMTNGTGKVHELTWREINTLKVADKKHPELGNHSVPTFKEVLAFCKDKVKIYLDFKNASVALAWQAIQDAGMKSSIVVYINSEEQYKQWRSLAPEVPLMISLPAVLVNKQQVLDFLVDVDAEILDGSYLDYTVEKAEAVHQSNRKIWADIQHPEENKLMWEKALRLKVDGLQTDHPGELIEYLTQRGLR